jgi:hypothetical protein
LCQDIPSTSDNQRGDMTNVAGADKLFVRAGSDTSLVIFFYPLVKGSYYDSFFSGSGDFFLVAKSCVSVAMAKLCRTWTGRMWYVDVASG